MSRSSRGRVVQLHVERFAIRSSSRVPAEVCIQPVIATEEVFRVDDPAVGQGVSYDQTLPPRS